MNEKGHYILIQNNKIKHKNTGRMCHLSGIFILFILSFFAGLADGLLRKCHP